jgi:hypothetical protein
VHWSVNTEYAHKVSHVNILHTHVIVINKNHDMKFELLSCICIHILRPVLMVGACRCCDQYVGAYDDSC